MDWKIWLAAILLIVGFFAGMKVADARFSKSAEDSMTKANAVQQKVAEFQDAVGAAAGFIQTVKTNSPDAYQAALDQCAPKARTAVAKMVQ
jgi:hypothetical protein